MNDQPPQKSKFDLKYTIVAGLLVTIIVLLLLKHDKSNPFDPEEGRRVSEKFRSSKELKDLNQEAARQQKELQEWKIKPDGDTNAVSTSNNPSP